MSGLTVKKILVPTDFSEGSGAALQYAIGLARICSARLVLLHVMELAVYAVDFAMTHPGVPADVRRRLDDMIEDWVRRAKAEGVEAEGVLATGTPYVEIGKAVERHGIDLIVMGTHGRTGVARAIMGSTAERVVRLAPCPVLTVKAEVKSAPPVEARTAEVQATEPSTFCHLPSLFRVACVVAVVIAFLVCASPTVISAQDEERGTIEVVIRNSSFVYQVRILRVDEQAVIVVRNADTIQHGFTSAAIAEFDARVETEGLVTYGKGIKGLYLDPGQEVRIRFTPTWPVKMTFRCDIHPAMKGEIVFLSVGAT